MNSPGKTKFNRSLLKSSNEHKIQLYIFSVTIVFNYFRNYYFILIIIGKQYTYT